MSSVSAEPDKEPKRPTRAAAAAAASKQKLKFGSSSSDDSSDSDLEAGDGGVKEKRQSSRPPVKQRKRPHHDLRGNKKKRKHEINNTEIGGLPIEYANELAREITGDAQLDLRLPRWRDIAGVQHKQFTHMAPSDICFRCTICMLCFERVPDPMIFAHFKKQHAVKDPNIRKVVIRMEHIRRSRFHTKAIVTLDEIAEAIPRGNRLAIARFLQAIGFVVLETGELPELKFPAKRGRGFSHKARPSDVRAFVNFDETMEPRKFGVLADEAESIVNLLCSQCESLPEIYLVVGVPLVSGKIDSNRFGGFCYLCGTNCQANNTAQMTKHITSVYHRALDYPSVCIAAVLARIVDARVWRYNRFNPLPKYFLKRFASEVDDVDVVVGQLSAFLVQRGFVILDGEAALNLEVPQLLKDEEGAPPPRFTVPSALSEEKIKEIRETLASYKPPDDVNSEESGSEVAQSDAQSESGLSTAGSSTSKLGTFSEMSTASAELDKKPKMRTRAAVAAATSKQKLKFITSSSSSSSYDSSDSDFEEGTERQKQPSPPVTLKRKYPDRNLNRSNKQIGKYVRSNTDIGGLPIYYANELAREITGDAQLDLHLPRWREIAGVEHKQVTYMAPGDACFHSIICMLCFERVPDPMISFHFNKQHAEEHRNVRKVMIRMEHIRRSRFHTKAIVTLDEIAEAIPRGNRLAIARFLQAIGFVVLETDELLHLKFPAQRASGNVRKARPTDVREMVNFDAPPVVKPSKLFVAADEAMAIAQVLCSDIESLPEIYPAVGLLRNKDGSALDTRRLGGFCYLCGTNCPANNTGTMTKHITSVYHRALDYPSVCIAAVLARIVDARVYRYNRFNPLPKYFLKRFASEVDDVDVVVGQMSAFLVQRGFVILDGEAVKNLEVPQLLKEEEGGPPPKFTVPRALSEEKVKEISETLARYKASGPVRSEESGSEAAYFSDTQSESGLSTAGSTTSVTSTWSSMSSRSSNFDGEENGNKEFVPYSVLEYLRTRTEVFDTLSKFDSSPGLRKEELHFAIGATMFSLIVYNGCNVSWMSWLTLKNYVSAQYNEQSTDYIMRFKRKTSGGGLNPYCDEYLAIDVHSKRAIDIYLQLRERLCDGSSPVMCATYKRLESPLFISCHLKPIAPKDVLHYVNQFMRRCGISSMLKAEVLRGSLAALGLTFSSSRSAQECENHVLQLRRRCLEQSQRGDTRPEYHPLFEKFEIRLTTVRKKKVPVEETIWLDRRSLVAPKPLCQRTKKVINRLVRQKDAFDQAYKRTLEKREKPTVILSDDESDDEDRHILETMKEENDGVESEMDDEKKTKRKEKQAKRPKRAASPGVLENAETQEKKHEVSMVANEKDHDSSDMNDTDEGMKFLYSDVCSVKDKVEEDVHLPGPSSSFSKKPTRKASTDSRRSREESSDETDNEELLAAAAYGMDITRIDSSATSYDNDERQYSNDDEAASRAAVRARTPEGPLSPRQAFAATPPPSPVMERTAVVDDDEGGSSPPSPSRSCEPRQKKRKRSKKKTDLAIGLP